MRGFVPFLLVTLLIALVLRVDALSYVVYLLAGLYALSHLWVQRMTRNLSGEPHFDNYLFAGESLQITLDIRNTGWVPIPWIEVNYTFPVELTSPLPGHLLSLAAHARHQYQYKMLARRRGYYPIGPFFLHFGDILGIIPRQTLAGPQRHITVYPRVMALQDLGLPTRSPLAELATQVSLFEDPVRVIGVRDYEPGDSPRRIHWTTSASVNRLLVKRYQPSIARDTLICLNMNPDDYPRERTFQTTETAIIAAASVVNHIIAREKQAAGLLLEALDPVQGAVQQFYLPPRRETGQLIALLEMLARIQTTVRPFADLVRGCRLRMKFGTTLVVITGQETEELFDVLLPLQRAGVAIALLLIQPREARHTILPVPRGITAYRIYRAPELEGGLHR